MLLLTAVVCLAVFVAVALAWIASLVLGRSAGRSMVEPVVSPLSPKAAFIFAGEAEARRRKVEKDAEVLFGLAVDLQTPIPSTLTPVPVPHPASVIPTPTTPSPKP